MRKKVLIIVLIIIAFLCGLYVGIKIKNFKILTKEEPKEEVKTTLTGLYMTDKLENVMGATSYSDLLSKEVRYTITIYNNNTLVTQKITISYLKDKGYIISKGASTSFTYSINNETRTMIVRGLEKNTSYTFTYSDDFNTIIDNDNKTYKYYSGTLEDNIEGKNIRETQREEGLEGTYKQENGNAGFTFNKDGTLSYGYQDTFYFLYDDKIFIYMDVNGDFYYEGILTDNKTKLTITKTNNANYKDYTDKRYGSNVFILQQ